MHKESADELLINGLKILDISFTKTQITAFLTYLEELKRWNKAYNLTGLKTDRDIIIKHFLDSLLFIKVFPENARTVADIGSGAGFPGIPVKIISPTLKIFLVEPTQKKALFLKHICAKLGLDDIEIINSRIEDIEVLRVDVAVTRALFNISDFIKKAGKVLNKKGVLILNKGPRIYEELRGLESINIAVTDIELPFQNIVRHMVVVRV